MKMALATSRGFLGFGVLCALCGSTLFSQALAVGIQPIPQKIGTLPTIITHHTKITLECGTTYYGPLELSNLSYVSIETSGLTSSCGRAVITTAVPVPTWQVYKGSIYMAKVPKPVAQVFVDGQLMGVAHYPNSLSEKGWIQPTSVTATTMQVAGLPLDLVGAKATIRGSYPWAIGTRTVTAYDGKTLTVPANTDKDLIAEDSMNLGRFYLEGKLWMLDSPGEWAWSNGYLYLWMPDGKSPVGRVLAAPNTNYIINARGTTLLSLKDVRILGGNIGIDAGYSNQLNKGSDHLQLSNTEIAYSNWVGLYASEAKDFAVDGSQIFGALHSGIYDRTQATPYTGTLKHGGVIVRNSTFTNINTTGMHKGSDGSIFMNNEYLAEVTNNVIVNSGKSGIFLGESKNALIKDNRVLGACRTHGDCGGIYVFSRSGTPLYTRIVGNLVRDVNGEPARAGSTKPERYGIYLDDYATGVTVMGNTIMNNDSGMQLHLAFNNSITWNIFDGNVTRHVLLSEGGGPAGSMHGNVISNNMFKGPSLIYLFAVQKPTTAATLSGNNYTHSTASPMVDPSTVLPY
jgi:hypothetical protein